ncbi:2-dehydro-3-deoxygalactonokinase [Sphingomonas quercus]|uniref:2-dehydro-3-deoxygalactonokinase n=1 Tax=Sphingomonas quercus TaxID=2842451 RepID=A0ABS6BGD0_9SPHN|nr:2-dehydro-3-deoxygalactonokinase [Sphingomonas quercus]MBU3077356.1 2-dehydro-3-deoxygalactonokinase [Sphingomonas quercus]
MNAAMIGVDWGTSNMRGWAFDDAGEIVAQAARPSGINAVTDGDFAAVLREMVGGWTDGGTPIVMGGMIGSRQGWREAPYLPCPVRPEALAAAAMPIDTGTGPGWIVPGVSRVDAEGVADVMRGEEVQLLGAGIADGLVLLPGTHGKWVRIEGGAIITFRTFMTGELFALLKDRSLLGRLMAPGRTDWDAFDRGVDRALHDPALTALLFTVRTEGLSGRTAPEALADYLSGLLIGAEIAGGGGTPGERISVIATGKLAERYARALPHAGWPAPELIAGEAASIAGLRRVGQAILKTAGRG